MGSEGGLDDQMFFFGMLKSHVENCKATQCECMHIAASLEGLTKF